MGVIEAVIEAIITMGVIEAIITITISNSNSNNRDNGNHLAAGNTPMIINSTNNKTRVTSSPASCNLPSSRRSTNYSTT